MPTDKTESIENILASSKSVKNDKKDVKERIMDDIRLQEAENIIKMTLRAGVPKELIGCKEKIFRKYCKENLNSDIHGTSKTEPDKMTDLIYDLKSGWQKKKLIILVDGGTKEARMGLSYLILARAVLGNFYNVGRTGVTIPYSMLKVKFNSFDLVWQNFITNLLGIPAIYISEVFEANGFRSGGDGYALMDQLLETKDSPVILSLCTPPEKFSSANTYGSAFRDLIDNSKGIAILDDRLWRFSLKTKTVPSDPIDFVKSVKANMLGKR